MCNKARLLKGALHNLILINTIMLKMLKRLERLLAEN